MESDQPSEEHGRKWTGRFSGPIRYNHFTDLDAGGRPSIFFKFDESAGGSGLPPEVWDILRSTKYLDRSPEHGGGQHPTGLSFNRSKKHGRVWRLPDTPTGRTAAAIIVAKLTDLIEKLDQENGRGR